MDRDFKGIWIPREIWLSHNLTMQEKIFLVEIDSLDNNGGCYAMNEHFSKFFKLSKNRCSEIIKSLESKGYIRISYLKEGKQIVKRIIKVTSKAFCRDNDNSDPLRDIEDPLRNVDRPLRDVDYPPSENWGESNTLSNNTFRDIYNNTSCHDEDHPVTKKVATPYKGIVDKYNDICKSLPKVQKLTDKRKRLLKALYNSQVVKKDINRLYKIFELTEDSEFLSGRNGKWPACNLDWLIKIDNAIKVLEGTYANKDTPKPKQQQPASGFINYKQPDEEKYANHEKKLALKMQLEAGKISQHEYIKLLEELNKEE